MSETNLPNIRKEDTQIPIIEAHQHELKFMWLAERLKSEGIDFNWGETFQGPELFVQASEAYKVFTILAEKIGELWVGSEHFITWNDLPPNHPVFAQLLDKSYQEAQTTTLGLRFTERILPFNNGVDGSNVDVRMFDIESSNVSTIGVTIPGYYPTPLEVNIPETEVCHIYVTFKGQPTYYYYDTYWWVWKQIYNEALKKASSKEASVGKLINRLLKDPADAGHINCFKLDGFGKWVKVLPKAERPKKSKGGKKDEDDSPF